MAAFIIICVPIIVTKAFNIKTIPKEKSNGGEKIEIPQEDKEFEIKEDKNIAKSPEKEIIIQFEDNMANIKFGEKKNN